MNYDKMATEMFEIINSLTEATFKNIALLQNQTERMAKLLLDQSNTLQSEGRKYVNEWIKDTKKNQEELKSKYSEGMQNISEILQTSAKGPKK